MANILCIWEMGGSLGHLAQLKPFVDCALAHNHRVTLVAKELHNLNTVFKDYEMAIFQAPYHFRTPFTRIKPLLSYSQLVLQRFETEDELAALCHAWSNIFKVVEPDVVIYDFAPSALIASIHQPWKKWIIGNGFFIPRCDLSYFGLFPGVKNTPENRIAIENAETRLLDMINHVLGSMDRASINTPGELIKQADNELLLTLPELDHFGARAGYEYLGVFNALTGAQPKWHKESCQKQEPVLKAFGYLSYFKGIDSLFDQLVQQRVSLCIYSRNIPEEVRSKYPEIVFFDQPVNFQASNSGIDFVINMGNHSTAAQCFLAGIPQLIIPSHQEQYYLAQRISAAKRGVVLLVANGDYEKAVTRIINMSLEGKLFVEPSYRDTMTGQLLRQRISNLFQSIE